MGSVSKYYKWWYNNNEDEQYEVQPPEARSSNYYSLVNQLFNATYRPNIFNIFYEEMLPEDLSTNINVSIDAIKLPNFNTIGNEDMLSADNSRMNTNLSVGETNHSNFVANDTFIAEDMFVDIIKLIESDILMDSATSTSIPTHPIQGTESVSSGSTGILAAGQPIEYGSFSYFVKRNSLENEWNQDTNGIRHQSDNYVMATTYENSRERHYQSQNEIIQPPCSENSLTTSSPEITEIASGSNNGSLSDLDDVENDVRRELREDFFKERIMNLPPPFYTCKICLEKGHYVKYCLQGKVATGFTPYQGEKKSVGMFRCPKCYHKWDSQNCLANIGQHCRKCNVLVAPDKMYKLPKKSHQLLKKGKSIPIHG